MLGFVPGLLHERISFLLIQVKCLPHMLADFFYFMRMGIGIGA